MGGNGFNGPAWPGSGGGGGDDGKGDGPKKKKKNRPSQKQRKRLAAQREAANRGADGEAGPSAEVKQEDTDYGEEELEELGGLARQVAVKASEAYARGTLASVRSRPLHHLEKAGATPGLGSSLRRFSERQWPTCASSTPTRVRPCTDPRPWAGIRSTTRCTLAWRGLLAWPSGSVTRARGPGAGDSRWSSRHPGCRSPWPRGSACSSRECGASSGLTSSPPFEWGTWCSSLWRVGLQRP